MLKVEVSYYIRPLSLLWDVRMDVYCVSRSTLTGWLVESINDRKAIMCSWTSQRVNYALIWIGVYGVGL